MGYTKYLSNLTMAQTPIMKEEDPFKDMVMEKIHQETQKSIVDVIVKEGPECITIDNLNTGFPTYILFNDGTYKRMALTPGEIVEYCVSANQFIPKNFAYYRHNGKFVVDCCRNEHGETILYLSDTGRVNSFGTYQDRSMAITKMSDDDYYRIKGRILKLK